MSFGRILLACIVVLAAGAGGAFYLWQNAKQQFFGPGPNERATYFQINRGQSVASVSEELIRQGLISNALIFQYGTRLTEQGGRVKFGNFVIPKQASMSEILEIITDSSASRNRFLVTLRISADQGTTVLLERPADGSGLVELARFADAEPVPNAYSAVVDSTAHVAFQVAVPEGLTSWQITEALNSAEFLDGEAGDLPSEGALAPDTYEVQRGTRVVDLVARMAASQQAILEEEWAARTDGLPVETPHEALILASLVEKETGVAEEREVVASVFVNRLNRPMRLQTDPSIIYGITAGKRPLGRGLRQSELKRKTPYNTYTNDGLPPTPICNPGRAAIRATLNPAETDYLFFVADGTGGHAFAVTYEEHRKNVGKWRQIEAERSNGG